jgi:tetratricopeptide (TPR) repeat protein
VEAAIGYCEQALALARETGDRRGEGNHLGNLAEALLVQGEVARALGHVKESLRIAEEIGSPDILSYHATTLALIHAVAGDFAAALAAAARACAHDVPTNNAAAQLMRGIAALRLGRTAIACAAFRAARAAAESLPHYRQLYDQLDALGLARCGLALTEPEARGAHLRAAREAFAAARALTAAPGVVAYVERQLDLLGGDLGVTLADL